MSQYRTIDDFRKMILESKADLNLCVQKNIIIILRSSNRSDNHSDKCKRGIYHIKITRKGLEKGLACLMTLQNFVNGKARCRKMRNDIGKKRKSNSKLKFHPRKSTVPRNKFHFKEISCGGLEPRKIGNLEVSKSVAFCEGDENFEKETTVTNPCDRIKEPECKKKAFSQSEELRIDEPIYDSSLDNVFSNYSQENAKKDTPYFYVSAFHREMPILFQMTKINADPLFH